MPEYGAADLPTEKPQQTPSTTRWYKNAKNLKTLALGGALSFGAIAGGNTAIASKGQTEGRVCALTVEVGHTPISLHDRPSVSLELAPGFSAEIPHASDNPFLKTNVRVTDVDREEILALRKKLETGTEEDLQNLEQTCRDDAHALVVKSGEKALLVGGAGALLGALATFGMFEVVTGSKMSRKRRCALLAGATLVAALPGVGSVAWAGSTVDEAAIKNPRYSGYMEDIRKMVDSSQVTLKQYQKKSGELTQWIEQVGELQEKLSAETLDDQYLKILVISDIHSRPCAYERVDVLAEAYDVDFILNGGDEREWDERETGLLVPTSGCGGILSPAYVKKSIFQVKGNHDGPQTVEQLDAYKNVRMVNGTTSVEYTVGNVSGTLKIEGIPDVRYTPDDELQGKDEPKKDLLELYDTDRLAKLAESNPDIVMTHDPELLREMNQADLIPESATLLSAGHTHHARVDQETFSAPLLVTGTSGGGGLNTYQDGGQPSAYSVVYLDPTTKEVARIELISVTNDGVVTIRNVQTAEASN